MNIRKEILQSMYDLVTNEELCEDMSIKFIAMMNLCEENFSKDKEDDFMSAMCDLQYASFMAGANMALDFIAGREVQ